MDTTRTALFPQIRILEEHSLVKSNADIYNLTTIGKLVVNKMIPLLDTFEVLDLDIDYWGTHNFNFIPSPLLRNFFKIKDWTVLHPDYSGIFDLNQEIHKKAILSDSISTMTATLQPYFIKYATEAIDNKKLYQLSLII